MNVSCLNVNPAGPVAQSRNPAALAIAVNLPEAFRADLALYLKREGLSCLEASERLGEMLNRHIDERTLYRWQEPNGYPVPLNAAVLISILGGGCSVIKAFASAINHACIKLPAHAPHRHEEVEEILKMIRESAEAAEEATKAAKSSRLGDAGMGRITKEVSEMIDQGIVLKKTFGQKWAKTREARK